MEIKLKKSSEGKITFELLGELFDLNYKGFEKIIDEVYDNKENVEIIADEELNEYKELIQSIIVESRKEDFINAVTEAKRAKQRLQEAEVEMLGE